MKRKCLLITLVLGLGLTMALLWLLSDLGTGPPVARAGDLHVCPSGCTYSSIQAAVDDANNGDVIKVAAGTYTGVEGRLAPPGYPYPPASGTITQVVYINKSVTIQGGYTTTNWTIPYPITQPTTLDAQGQGRVLYITGDVSPIIEGLRITGGNAAGLGGDPWQDDAGGGLYLYYSAAKLSGNAVLANTAGWNGGGLFLYRSAATLSSNTISNNSASQASGGGLYLYYSDATLMSNTISHNSAYNHSGGGLALLHSDAALISNTVSNNSADSGGGLYLGYGDDATLTSNTVSDNSADSGGGLYLHYSDATLGDNSVSDNTAYGAGGGLYLNYSYAQLNDNAVFSNTATRDGGGLYLYASYATLTDNAVSGNLAKLDGGGLALNNSDAQLSGNTVFANSARRYGGGLALNDSDGAMLSNNTITTNTATGRGGGLYLYHSAATLSGNTVSGNSNTETWGGGLLLFDSDATLNGNTISANFARTAGGGLVLWYSSNATLTNNVVAGNQAGIAGSGLYISGSSPRLLHTTVARNHDGDGSGVYVTNADSSYSTVALTNTILVSHMVGITVAAGNTATLEGTLWGSDAWANRDDWGGDGTVITGTVNVRGNPGFVDPDGGDYHIVESSCAVDRGLNAGVEDDIDGEPRPYPYGSEEYDIGADEFHPNLNLTVTKYASSDPVHTGAQLTYTIFVTNTGNVTLSATITDILPTQVVPTGVLTWTTVITAPGGIWSQAVPATVAMWYAGPLTNVVRVTTKEGVSGVYTCTTEAIVQHCYLPLVLRDF